MNTTKRTIGPKPRMAPLSSQLIIIHFLAVLLRCLSAAHYSISYAMFSTGSPAPGLGRGSRKVTFAVYRVWVLHLPFNISLQDS